MCGLIVIGGGAVLWTALAASVYVLAIVTAACIGADRL
jgi:hypothetical protein